MYFWDFPRFSNTLLKISTKFWKWSKKWWNHHKWCKVINDVIFQFFVWCQSDVTVTSSGTAVHACPRARAVRTSTPNLRKQHEGTCFRRALTTSDLSKLSTLSEFLLFFDYFLVFHVPFQQTFKPGRFDLLLTHKCQYVSSSTFMNSMINCKKYWN